MRAEKRITSQTRSARRHARKGITSQTRRRSRSKADVTKQRNELRTMPILKAGAHAVSCVATSILLRSSTVIMSTQRTRSRKLIPIGYSLGLKLKVRSVLYSVATVTGWSTLPCTYSPQHSPKDTPHLMAALLPSQLNQGGKTNGIPHHPHPHSHHRNLR